MPAATSHRSRNWSTCPVSRTKGCTSTLHVNFRRYNVALLGRYNALAVRGAVRPVSSRRLIIRPNERTAPRRDESYRDITGYGITLPSEGPGCAGQSFGLGQQLSQAHHNLAHSKG